LALLTQSYRTFLPQTNNQLRTSSNAKNQATLQDGRVVVQNVHGRPNRGQGMNPWGGSATGYGEAHNRVGNVNQGQARLGQARTVKCYNCNGTGHIARNCTQLNRPQNSEYFKYKVLLMQAQENGVALDAEQLIFLAGGPDNAFDDDDLALNVDNVFQAEDCDAFDLDNKVAIGYKNPLCLTRAKQAQPALYNGHEILKDNHEPAKVFSMATKSELNVARFAKMHVANTSVEARCLALKAKLATLRAKSHQENQGELIKHFSKLETQNDLFRAENNKIKQHYKELYNSIKITHVEPIVPRLRNNRDAHLDYLRHLKESVETIRDIVEEAKVVRTLDRSIVSACRYTKHSQELLEYTIGTCPQGSQQRAKQLANTPLIRKKQATIAKPSDRQDSNKQVHVVAVKPQKINVPMPPSTGVTSYPKASRSQPKRNPKTNRILPAKGANKLPVEDLPRTNKSHFRTTNRVDSSSRLKRTIINLNSDSMCRTCNKFLTSFDPDMCVAVCMKSVVRPYSTRHNCEIERKIKQVVQILLWYLDSGCSKHMMGDHSRLLNFVKKFIGTVRFRNDHFGAIMGYGDYVVGESVISRVYYVEGLGHNLFSVGQFCDFDLEVAFRKHSCYVRDTDGVDLIKGSRGSNLYTISVEDMMNLGPAPKPLMPRPISSGLVPNPAPAIPYVPPTKKELEILFQPMFDEYFKLSTSDQQVPLAPVVHIPVNAPCPSVSISVDQDAPS
nr:integrase, catalytic region, zinc finger, CCHC-type, peptidase aspartic, catalytic [Tanacetum cinerariifolium]